MKLTDENQDYFDCGDPTRETGIPTPRRIAALIEKRRAEKAGRSPKLLRRRTQIRASAAA
jgi:hypothetical protein